MQFTTKLSGSEIEIRNYLPNLSQGDDYEIEDANCEIKWYVELETRDWGIKGMSWFVDGVSGYFTVVKFDAAGDTSQEAVFTEAGFDVDFDIEMDGDTLSISDIEIDYKDKYIRIT